MAKVKMTRKGWVIASIVGFIAVVLVIVIIAARKKKNSAIASPDYPNESYFPLENGSQNDYVRVWQEWLIEKGGSLPSGIDGKFGPETQAATEIAIGKSIVDHSTYIKAIIG
jgi:hypothetical protein